MTDNIYPSYADNMENTKSINSNSRTNWHHSARSWQPLHRYELHWNL